MLCIYNTCIDPYFNLAAEEYLLKEHAEDCFMLWRNAPAIIVGKHQNTNAEINGSYVNEQGIKVVRRLSGGGAVFHDLGNLNFTFIMSGEDHGKIDFRRYTLPILQVLQQLDVNAKFEGRNDLTIDGRKFSGNAEYLYKNRILHHGTLLFAAHLPDLSQALNVDPLKYSDKSIKSIRSRVTNICDHLKHPLDITVFAEMLRQHVLGMYADAVHYEFSEADIQRITELRDQKYMTWEWNFGASPKYTFRKNTPTKYGGHLEIILNVEHGIIREAKIYGDCFYKDAIVEIENIVRDTMHDRDCIHKQMMSVPLRLNRPTKNLLNNVSIDEFIDAMF